MNEYMLCVLLGWLYLLACVQFIFGCVSVVHSMCDLKSFCVVYVSLVICRWDVISEGYVCIFLNVCIYVYICIICYDCILGHMSVANVLGHISFV